MIAEGIYIYIANVGLYDPLDLCDLPSGFLACSVHICLSVSCETQHTLCRDGTVLVYMTGCVCVVNKLVYKNKILWPLGDPVNL